MLGIAFSIFVLERAVRACVCVDERGLLRALRTGVVVCNELEGVSRFAEARWRETGACRLYRPSCASSVGRTGAVEMEIVQTRALNPNATSLATGGRNPAKHAAISGHRRYQHADGARDPTPVGIAITSSINADDLFSITLGNAPNTRMCQEPAATLPH